MAGERGGAVVEAEVVRVMCIFLHGKFWGGGIIPQSCIFIACPKLGEIFDFWGVFWALQGMHSIRVIPQSLKSSYPQLYQDCTMNCT
jgi:hypothetical protein